MDGLSPILDKQGRFVWTEERAQAAIKLAEGWSQAATARELEISATAIHNWRKYDEFQKEVDRLTMMYGLASKAERMRMISQAARQFVKEDGSLDVSGFSLLDLLKEARMQTEGVKLDVLSTLLAPVTEETGSVAGSRSDRLPELPDPDTEETV